MSSRWRSVHVLVLLSILAAVGPTQGCSSKQIRYPEDHARYNKIDRAVEQLWGAYTRKELSEIKALMLPAEDLNRVRLEIEKDFRTYQEISLDFAIERIEIEGELVDVFVHWQGQWKETPNELGIRDRGHGVLHWVGVEAIMLAGLEGDFPFGMASRRATVESQGGGVF
ncbi:MAG: hypothetical protein ACE5NA_03070 [Nitrospiraceae bacterium]